MADIWEYIANYNPHGFYEDNRAKMLQNDINTARLGAINRENSLENTILELKNRVANGDKSALKPLGVYSPETTKKYIDNEEEMLNIARPYAQAILRMAPENREKGYQQMLKSLPNVDTSDMPDYYDENMIMLLANSDPQKLRDERLNEMAQENATIAYGRDLNKLQIASDLMEQRSQNAFNRDIQKLQYAYDRADQKTKEGIDFITSQVREGNIDRNAAITAAGKLLGVELSPKTENEKLQEEVNKLGLDYMLGNLTPEQENDYIAKTQALSQAKSTSKSSIETPAQQMERLRKAGFTADSVQQAVMTGDASLLVPDTTPKGSISANTQGNNAYNQWLEQNPNATPEEQRNARYQFGVPNFDDTNALNIGKIKAQTQGKLENTTLQGKIAIDIENLKHGHNLTMADVNEANSEKLESLKQKYKVDLRYIDDEISKGKELRQLDNDKSLAEFKNSLPTEERLQRLALARQLLPSYPEGTTERQVYDDLLAKDYQNALKVAELDRQYKQASLKKTLAELPFVGKTNDIKDAEWLMQNNSDLSPQEAFELANKNKGTNVTVNNTEQDAFAKQLGKNSAEQVKKNEEAIESSRNQLFMLNNMADSLERANDVNVYFGPGGEFVYQMKSLAQALGKNTDGLADTAIIQTGKSMLMAALRKDLMPGQLSDRDLRFLVNMMPGVEKTVEQNRAILNMYKKMHEQKIRYATAYNDYMFNNNGDARGWNKYAQEMGIFKSPNETIFTKEDFDAVRGNSKNSGKIMNGKISWSIDE